MIRSSKHTLKFSNSGKILALQEFLSEYRKAVQLSIDSIWENSFSYKKKTFSIKDEQLEVPLFLDYKIVNYQGKLSARAFCSAFERSEEHTSELQSPLNL